MILLDNEKKGSRQAMSEDIITKILDRNNLNLAFKNVKANKGASGICRLAFCMKLIINNIIKINEESPSNNLTIF